MDEPTELEQVRATLELVAGNLHAAILKRNDAPHSAEAHIDEASNAICSYRPLNGNYGPQAAKLRNHLWQQTREERGQATSLNAARVAAEIVQAVAELPDRSSPPDWPEAMLVTASELTAIIMDVWPAVRTRPEPCDTSGDDPDQVGY